MILGVSFLLLFTCASDYLQEIGSLKVGLTIIRRYVVVKNSLLMIFCFSLIASSSWALDFNPGKYEISSRVEMPGMPGAIPPQTMTQCMTDKDIVPISNSDIQGCKLSDVKQTETSVSWTMQCHQQGQNINGTGKVIYHGDTFEGTIITNLGPDSGNMTMTTVITGQRISDCD